MNGTELKRRNPAVDFVRGVGFYVSGVKMLRRHPSLLAISLVPIGATVLLLLGLATGAAWGIGELTSGLLAGPWRHLAEAIVLILALLVGWFIYLPLARILLAPFAESLSRRTTRLISGEPIITTDNGTHGWLRAFGEGAKLVTLQIVITLAGMVIGAAFPPVAIPIGLTLGVVMASLDFIDVPLSVRGWSLRQKLALLVTHKALTAGFGAAAFATLFIPGLNLLLLPAGIVGATVLCRSIINLPQQAHQNANPS